MKRKRCSCGQIHEPGLLVECVGGPLDGESFDYSVGTPDGYEIDRSFGERRGGKKQYAFVPVAPPSAQQEPNDA